jgi:CRISP-associated protein Cas1
MTTLYVQRTGATLTRHDSSFIVRYRDGEQLQRQTIPAEKVSEVVIGAGCHITSGAIELLMKLEVPVSFVNFHDKYIGALCTPINGNQALRRAQYAASEQDEFCLSMARAFIAGKTHNQRTITLRYARELPELTPLTEGMREMIAGVATAPNIETVMGLEGQTARLYFEGLRLICGEAWAFDGRNRRPPRDPVNAMLSYGYAILEGHVTSMLHRVGLDPYIGFMHQPFPARKSLALDLMEEFRPVVVDSAILGIIGNRMLSPADFEIQDASCRMSDAARKTFLIRLQARFDQTITHPITQEKTTYSKLILSQARQIGSLLFGEWDGYTPLRVR